MEPRHRHSRRGLLGVPAALLLAAATLARADEKPLPALVPADVGLCIEVRGLAAAVQEFRASAHFGRLGQFPPWERWRQREGQGLTQLSDQAATAVGVSWTDMWEKVLGHQLLIGV